jgi:hypothetical protein
MSSATDLACALGPAALAEAAGMTPCTNPRASPCSCRSRFVSRESSAHTLGGQPSLSPPSPLSATGRIGEHSDLVRWYAHLIGEGVTSDDQ